MLRSRQLQSIMNVKRAATIAVAGGALLAWFAGAATSLHPDPRPIVVRPSPIDARGHKLANEIAKLHERLRPTSTPSQPARNLFTFRAAAARPALPPPPAVVQPLAVVEAAAPRPSPPALTLAGIAEDDGADGPDRTAFISSAGQLHIVKVGDIVQRYKVTAISADVVELTDLDDGTVRRLALR
jgi:hypothetical protein